MQELSINGLRLYFDQEEQGTVELVKQACLKTKQLLQETWELEEPEDCRVYIMTSWPGFMFRSAPWPWKVVLAVTFPLWVFRVRRMWPYVGGWEQSYGQRRTVGVKSPELLQHTERSIGDRFFTDWESVGEQLQSITCHELTHAYTSHLKLPTWLKEGLAMVVVDKFFEKPTVRDESIKIFKSLSNEDRFRGTQKLDVRDEDSLVYQYLRGYWLTRYIAETRPGLLRELLSGGYRQREYEDKIAAAFGERPDAFWNDIDGDLVSHYSEIKGIA